MITDRNDSYFSMLTKLRDYTSLSFNSKTTKLKLG